MHRSSLNVPVGLTIGAVAIALAAAPAPDRDPRPDLPQPDATELVGARTVGVLVDLADDLSAAERAEFIASLPSAAALNSAYSADEGLYRLQLPAAGADALVDALSSDEHVEFAELEGTYATFGTTPDDPLYPFQWHFDQIDVEEGWSNADGTGVVVAVIDTGVAFADAANGRFRQVQDLAGNDFVGGYDFVDDDENPFDEHGHGTHVAGTIAQTTNNGYGVTGVAPRARIMPIRVLDAAGRGNTADIAESIRWAADNGADVINMSLGGPLPSRIMQDAVNYAHRKGVTIIAAAGNSGWSMPSFPAAYDHVIAVSATQYDRSTTFYSNYGRYIDIAAPGGNTRVDQNDDGRPDGVMQETLVGGDPSRHEFALYMGTSMAAPHVAGVAALVHQLGVTAPDQVERVLQSSASTDVPDMKSDRYGAGLLDAGAATSQAVSRFQGPRALLGLSFGLLALGFAGRRGRRDVHRGALGGAAVVAASGLGALALAFDFLGVPSESFAWAARTPMHWLDAVGASCATHSFVAMSAVPALGAYALFGRVSSPKAVGIVVGLMVGWAALLAGEALVPIADVGGIPGFGVADRLWLAANAALAFGAGAAALLRR